MSTSKKTSSKSSKSPAPATKSAASKAAPAPRAKAKAAVKSAVKPTAKPAPAAAVVTVPVAAPKPAPKPQASKPVQTVISAQVDVGFGNSLSIRGEGAGLSWNAGLPMDCVEANLWRVTLPESARGYAFKFLVNDLTWSTGPDYTAASGASVTLTPEF